MRARSTRQANRRKTLAGMGVAANLWTAEPAHAGSARDYLNAPVDTWLLNYNAGYTTSLTPEDGTDTVPGVRANVLAQSVVLTRIMDYWGRTGGFSLVLPYALIDPSANRWMISPTVNFSYTPDEGWTWAETYVSGRVFTDNGNYLVNGAQTLTQRPLLRLEEHLSRNVNDALWLSAGAYYNLGGETSNDWIDQENIG